jgi:hypothetical protein
MDLESKRPSGPLFRVGRDRDAWAVPDWAYATHLFWTKILIFMAPLRAVFRISRRIC